MERSNGSGQRDEHAIKRRMRTLEREARREHRRRARLGRRSRDPAVRRAGDRGAGSDTATVSSNRTIARKLRRGVSIGLLAVFLFSFVMPPFLIPVEGEVTSRFFLRNAPDSPRLFDFEQHTGLDVAAPIGTPVIAARSGRVIRVADDPRYGLVVDVRHAFGWVTRYAHLSRVDVRERQLVLRRTRIGAVGATGRVTGPHLHFELRIAGRAFPPGWLLLFHRLRQAVFAG